MPKKICKDTEKKRKRQTFCEKSVFFNKKRWRKQEWLLRRCREILGIFLGTKLSKLTKFYNGAERGKVASTSLGSRYKVTIEFGGIER